MVMFNSRGLLNRLLLFSSYFLLFKVWIVLGTVLRSDAHILPNWRDVFGRTETGSGAKKRVVLRREFHSNFKVLWEKDIWTKFVFSLMVFVQVRLNEVHSNYCKCVGLFMQIFLLDHFVFLLEHSLKFQVTLSRFRFSFPSNLYCSHSEVKLVAKKNWLQHNKEGLIAEWAVLLVRKREVNGSNSGVVNYFCTLEKFLSRLHPLNYIALRAFRLTSLQVCDSQQMFWRRIIVVWAAVRRIWPPTHTHTHTYSNALLLPSVAPSRCAYLTPLQLS